MHICISANVDEDWLDPLRPTARRILDALLAGPLSLGELAEATGFTKAGLQRPLRNLERLGIVSHTYRPSGTSRQVVYALEGCSIHLEVTPPITPGARGYALAWTTAGRSAPEFPLASQVPKPKDRDDVLTALRCLHDGAPDLWPELFVILFGSLVRGDSTGKSDVDLLLVLPKQDARARNRLADVVADAQSEVTLPIQPFWTTRTSFLDAKTKIDSVAAREGVILHGDPREREIWNRMTRYRNIST